MMLPTRVYSWRFNDSMIIIEMGARGSPIDPKSAYRLPMMIYISGRLRGRLLRYGFSSSLLKCSFTR